MDATWTAEPWTLVMLAALCVGVTTLTHLYWRFVNRSKLPHDLERSRHDLELGVRGVVNACVELSERVRELVIVVKRLPPEYRPAAEHALRLAQVIEEATYEEGVRHGIFPRPMFNAGGPPPNRISLPDEEPEAEQRGNAQVIHLPTAKRELIGGQWLPATAPAPLVSRTGTG